MRILIVTAYFPWPTDTGGNLAQVLTMKALQQDHQITLAAPLISAVEAAGLPVLRRELPQVDFRAIPCGRQLSPRRFDRWRDWLRPPVRVWRQGRLALVKRWPRLNPHRAEKRSPIDQPIGYPFSPHPPEFLKGLADEFRRSWDIIQLEFAPLMPLGGWLPSEVSRIFVHHQLHWVTVQQRIEQGADTPYNQYLLKRIQAEEHLYLGNFDGVILFSQEDAQRLGAELHGVPLHVSPFPAPLVTQPPVAPKTTGDFFFLGTEDHPPNRQGLDWLLAQVWPGIRAQIPDASLRIIGKWSYPQIQRHNSHPGISFTGFVPRLEDLMANGIFLAPIHVGSGLRVKILTAFALGVPVVTTTLGCQGLGLEDGQQALIADEAGQFVEKAVRLALDPDLQRRLQNNSQRLLRDRFSLDSVRQSRNRIYQETVRRRATLPVR